MRLQKGDTVKRGKVHAVVYKVYSDNNPRVTVCLNPKDMHYEGLEYCEGLYYRDWLIKDIRRC